MKVGTKVILLFLSKTEKKEDYIKLPFHLGYLDVWSVSPLLLILFQHFISNVSVSSEKISKQTIEKKYKQQIHEAEKEVEFFFCILL